MSTFENIASNSGTICVGALAFALGDPSGGTLAATGMAGLAGIGIALRKTCARRACDAAAKATIIALRDTPDFAEVNLLRVETLLQDRQEHQSLNSQSLIAAYKKDTVEKRITALVTLLHNTIPFDGDTEQVKTLIRRALTASMRACYDDKAFRAQLSEETLIDIARKTDGIAITLDRVDANTAETKDDVKELLNRLGGFEAILANLESQSAADLRVIAAAFGEYALLEKPALIKFLTQKAEEYRSYRAQIDGLDERVAAIANLKGAAQDAAARLDFDEVETLLSRVDEVETEIAAETKEARATNALLRNRPEEAFQILCAAADSFASIDPSEPANRRHTYMQQLYYHGLRYGGQGIMLAIQMIRDALIKAPQDASSEIWAMCQNALGIALRTQAARTEGAAGTALLAEAAAAFRDAVTVYTRQEHPVDWAATQNNRANALGNQATRTEGAAGTALLAEAVTAYRDALTVRTRQEHPVGWAMTQNNLANALSNQAARTEGAAGAALLEEAFTAYRDALTVTTRHDHPVHWAETRGNLAICELTRADHEATPDPLPHLRAALEHVEAALTVFDPEHMPYNHTKATKLRNRIMARLAGV